MRSGVLAGLAHVHGPESLGPPWYFSGGYGGCALLVSEGRMFDGSAGVSRSGEHGLRFAITARRHFPWTPGRRALVARTW